MPAGARALVVTASNRASAGVYEDRSGQALAAGLTELAARALAGQGIRVNAIAPALMLPSGAQDEDNFARVHALNPLRRGVVVDDDEVGVPLVHGVDRQHLAGQPARGDQHQAGARAGASRVPLAAAGHVSHSPHPARPPRGPAGAGSSRGTAGG